MIPLTYTYYILRTNYLYENDESWWIPNQSAQGRDRITCLNSARRMLHISSVPQALPGYPDQGARGMTLCVIFCAYFAFTLLNILPRNQFMFSVLTP